MSGCFSGRKGGYERLEDHLKREEKERKEEEKRREKERKEEEKRREKERKKEEKRQEEQREAIRLEGLRVRSLEEQSRRKRK